MLVVFCVMDIECIKNILLDRVCGSQRGNRLKRLPGSKNKGPELCSSIITSIPHNPAACTRPSVEILVCFVHLERKERPPQSRVEADTHIQSQKSKCTR